MIARGDPRGQRGITLVELLVAMSIMLVLSTMIVGTWITLTNAYSFTSRSDKQRDFARQAIDRMAREIRDAQQPLDGSTTAFTQAYPNEVRFYSTFNTAGAAEPASEPRLTRLVYKVTNAADGVGAVYREFPGYDGDFDTPGTMCPNSWSTTSPTMAPAEICSRTGTYDSATNALEHSNGTTTLVDPSRIVEVEITMLVDLNPGKAPNYMDVSTKVQPRNVREF